MKDRWDKRNISVIKVLKLFIWPFIKVVFRLEIHGLENIESLKDKPCLYVSNHNVGALIESHSTLFIIQEKLGFSSVVYGFTHPSIFKIPGLKHYFQWIGAVPATYEIAESVFQNKDSLMIFPGGNKQALRSIWQYKNNQFRESHGWAKIAIQNKVPVIPITFKGSHFVNPILFSGEWLSKVLIIPWLLGLKSTSFSLGQILLSGFVFYLTHILSGNLLMAGVFAYFNFILVPLVIIFPSKITMTFHSAIMPESSLNLDVLEDKVGTIMDNIYS